MRTTKLRVARNREFAITKASIAEENLPDGILALVSRSLRFQEVEEEVGGARFTCVAKCAQKGAINRGRDAAELAGARGEKKPPPRVPLAGFLSAGTIKEGPGPACQGRPSSPQSGI